MKYAIEMGSGVMIYILSMYYKDWFRHSKVDRGIPDSKVIL
jgi:hypothetical protein